MKWKHVHHKHTAIHVRISTYDEAISSWFSLKKKRKKKLGLTWRRRRNRRNGRRSSNQLTLLLFSTRSAAGGLYFYFFLLSYVLLYSTSWRKLYLSRVTHNHVLKDNLFEANEGRHLLPPIRLIFARFIIFCSCCFLCKKERERARSRKTLSKSTDYFIYVRNSGNGQCDLLLAPSFPS